MKKIFIYIAVLLSCIACADKEPIIIEDYTFNLCITPTDTLLLSGQESSFLLEVTDYTSDEQLVLSYLINNARTDAIKIDGSEVSHDSYTLKDNKTAFSFTPQKSGEYNIIITVNNGYLSDYIELDLDIRESAKYIVNIKTSTGGTVTPTLPLEATYNEQIAITATADNYYHFDSWSDGSLTAQRTIVVTQDTTITAYFKENDDENFTPTLTLNDSNNYLETTREIVLDLSGYTQESITLNYRINDKTSESIYLNNVAVTHDNYSLTTSVDKKFIFTYVPNSVEEKTLQVTLTVTNEYKKSLELVIPVITTPESNFSLSVLPDATAGLVECNKTAATIKLYDTLKLTATANAGYSFSNFTVNTKEVLDNPLQIIVTEEYIDGIDIQAVFNANKYKVIFTSGEGGSVTNPGGTFDYNSNITSSAVADKGYQFIGWYVNDVIYSTDKELNVTVDLQELTYKALFEKVQYTLSSSSNPVEGGTLSGTGKYYYNDAISITATPTEGYVFNKFVVDGQEYTSNPLSLTMPNNDLLVQGYFDIITSNIIFTAGDGGSVTNAGGTYNYGTIVTTKAEPYQDMRFVGWYQNNVLTYTSAELSLTVGKDNISLEARFESNLRTITINNANPTLGDISGAGIYNYNSEVTLTATPIRHYHLQGWYENDVLTTSDNPYTFTVLQDRYFIAKFAQNEHTITTVSGSGYTITPSCTVMGGDSKTISLTIQSDYKLTGFLESNYFYNSATSSISLTDIDQDYIITPQVRYNIISFSLSARDDLLEVSSSVPAPCDLKISINFGQYILTMLKGTNNVYLETELDITTTYSIEYISGNDTDGYVFKY